MFNRFNSNENTPSISFRILFISDPAKETLMYISVVKLLSIVTVNLKRYSVSFGL